MNRLVCVIMAAPVLAGGVFAAEPSAEEVRRAMDRAATFFQSISIHGGYAGIYSLDLRKRYGESLHEKAAKDEIWIQPPGTPSVGEAFLRAWRVTGAKWYYRAARNVARALAWGQSAHGGWDHRAEVSALTPGATRPRRRKTPCTFDDRISQGALDFLMSFDQVADEPWLTEAVELGFRHLLAAQDANGGWPQWYPLRGGYHDFYTFNDRAINDCIAVAVRGWKLYGRDDLLNAANRGGEFILLSQLPPPQAGWAQQYSRDLKPARARSFEPAGVCSAVTAHNIRTLVELYLLTRDAKFLRPVEKALAWLDNSRLPNGKWARLYELGTNRPIYGDRDGKVHYRLDEISRERREGYSWQGEYGIGAARRLYEQVRRDGIEKTLARRAAKPSPESLRRRARGLAGQVRKVIDALDARGRWVSDGMIRSGDFVRNFTLLCEYLELLESTP